MIVLRWILSLIFNIQMYVAMGVIGIGFLPWAIFSDRGARAACKAYCRWVIFTLRLLCGLRCEVRGTPPPDVEAIVAAKHQSFLDVLLIFNAVPKGKFIMKWGLMFAPVIGQYGLRIGCVPVNRGKRGAAIAKMKADVARGASQPGQLIIYSQGTRVEPGVKKPYKVGTGLLYEQLGQPCYPVATNAGIFWPKRAVLRKPGLAVVEFLPAIAPGKPVAAFMAELEATVETTSDRLMAEAGFRPDQPA
jgi:1-acyl-sn-glycerol-3-phosphate acyltransferase